MQPESLFVLFAAIMLAWIIVMIYFLKSDRGEGVNKNIAGYMAFGFLWPVFRKHFDRPLFKREVIGWLFVIALMFIAIFASLTGMI